MNTSRDGECIENVKSRHQERRLSGENECMICDGEVRIYWLVAIKEVHYVLSMAKKEDKHKTD